MKNKIKFIEEEIKRFKEEVKKFTEWDTGKHILDFIDTRKAFKYGSLIGKRDILQELSSGGKTNGEKEIS